MNNSRCSSYDVHVFMAVSIIPNRPVEGGQIRALAINTARQSEPGMYVDVTTLSGPPLKDPKNCLKTQTVI